MRFYFFLYLLERTKRELTTKETIKIGAPIESTFIYFRPLFRKIPSAPKYKNTGFDIKYVANPIAIDINKVINSA